jgi:hypothetical protein
MIPRLYNNPMLFSVIFLVFSLWFVTCKRDDQLDHPIVFTGEVIEITRDGVVFHGRVIEQGTPIIDHGFVWDVNSNPTIAISYRKSLGSLETEIFSAEITAALIEGKKYYARTYAQTNHQVIYGMQVEFVSLGGKAPIVYKFEPEQGTWGDTISIYGRNFSTKKDENLVKIGNSILDAFYASDSIVKGVIPLNLDSISAKISVSVLGNIANAENPFVLLPPVINSFTPLEGGPAGTLHIHGRNFLVGKTVVTVGSKPAQIDSITNDHIKIISPVGNPEGPLQISVKVLSQTTTSQETYFYMPPVITSLIPNNGTWRDEIKIIGRNLSISGVNVRFNEIKANIIRSHADSLIVTIPDALLTPSAKISVEILNERNTFPADFTLKAPKIHSFEPQTASYGDEIEISGTNFHPILSVNKVYFGNTLANVVSSGQGIIKAKVPDNIYNAETPIRVWIAELPITESDNSFMLKMHSVEGINPSSCSVGDILTIRGNDFNPIINQNKVYIGNQQAEVIFSNNTILQVKTPFQLAIGEHPVKVNILDREVESPDHLTFYQPWSPLKNFPVNVANGYTFKLKGRYFLGGWNWMYEYFPETDTWIAKRHRPGSTEDVVWTLFTTATKAYILSQNELFQYDPETDMWTKMGTFIQPPFNREWGYRSFTVNETGYMIGDRTDLIYNGKLVKGRQVWRYDEDANRWRLSASIPSQGLTEGISFSIGGKAYVGFGKDESKIWEYDPATNSWTEKIDVTAEIGYRTHSCVFVINEIAYLVSGKSNKGVSDEMFTYDHKTNTLKKCANIPSWRYGAFAFSLPGGHAVVGGGIGDGNKRDVYLFDPEKLAPQHQP